MEPNLSGLSVIACAQRHIGAYSRGPSPTFEVTLGSILASRTSYMISPGTDPPQVAWLLEVS